jgi:hypothetical protein
VGRIVAFDDDRLSIRVGPHVWLTAGTAISCRVPTGAPADPDNAGPNGSDSNSASPDGVTAFVAEIERVHSSPHFTLSMRLPNNARTLNRRTSQQTMTRRSVTWSRLDGGRMLAGEVSGATIDLSATGCRFETGGPAPQVGQLIAVAIDLPLEPLTCLSYDMGVNDLPGPQLMTQTFVRVCFAAIRGDRQDRLRTWIDEQRGSLLTAGL